MVYTPALDRRAGCAESANALQVPATLHRSANTAGLAAYHGLTTAGPWLYNEVSHKHILGGGASGCVLALLADRSVDSEGGNEKAKKAERNPLHTLG